MAGNCRATCIGNMNKAVTIQHVVGTTIDAHGQVDKTIDSNWGTYLRTFAAVKSKGGREFWKVQQVNADVTHVWNCQWSSKIAEAVPEMRLVCEGVKYEILSVIDIDLAHREIEIQTARALQ
jgi:SPP1 family predicted phage head-tail adaptor